MCWLTNKNLSTTALSGHRMQSRRSSKSDGCKKRMARERERERERESQGNPCLQRDTMMMMMMITYYKASEKIWPKKFETTQTPKQKQNPERRKIVPKSKRKQNGYFFSFLHPTRHQLYGHLPPITKTIQVRRTRHAGHCWRSRDELIRDVLLWIPTHGRAKAGRPARTYIQQLCEDTGYCPEDLPRAMNDREEWRERVRDIRATSTI